MPIYIKELDDNLRFSLLYYSIILYSTGKLKKIEVISEKDLMKYIKLYNDLDFPHKPNVLGIVLIDFDDNENAYFVDLDSMEFSEETKNILKNEVSLNKFIKRVVGLCQLMD